MNRYKKNFPDLLVVPVRIKVCAVVCAPKPLFLVVGYQLGYQRNDCFEVRMNMVRGLVRT